jgi:hypothetical protein
MELNGCIWSETSSATLVHQNSAFRPETLVRIFLHAEGFLNAQKDNQTSFVGKWSRMDAFGAKQFLQLRYTKIVHLGPKHEFCIFLHAEGFRNAPKHNQTSFGV